MVEESTSSVPVPLLCLTSKICAEHYWVPPAYAKDNRQIARRRPEGKRKEHTAGVWRPGRIRNLVVNAVYKGEHIYGRRSKKQRELITRAVPAIVDAETWDKAQQTLRRNLMFATRNALRQYLLRGLLKCESVV